MLLLYRGTCIRKLFFNLADLPDIGSCCAVHMTSSAAAAELLFFLFPIYIVGGPILISYSSLFRVYVVFSSYVCVSCWCCRIVSVV